MMILVEMRDICYMSLYNHDSSIETNRFGVLGDLKTYRDHRHSKSVSALRAVQGERLGRALRVA